MPIENIKLNNAESSLSEEQFRQEMETLILLEPIIRGYSLEKFTSNKTLEILINLLSPTSTQELLEKINGKASYRTIYLKPLKKLGVIDSTTFKQTKGRGRTRKILFLKYTSFFYVISSLLGIRNKETQDYLFEYLKAFTLALLKEESIGVLFREIIETDINVAKEYMKARPVRDLYLNNQLLNAYILLYSVMDILFYAPCYYLNAKEVNEQIANGSSAEAGGWARVIKHDNTLKDNSTIEFDIYPFSEYLSKIREHWIRIEKNLLLKTGVPKETAKKYNLLEHGSIHGISDEEAVKRLDQIKLIREFVSRNELDKLFEKFIVSYLSHDGARLWSTLFRSLNDSDTNKLFKKAKYVRLRYTFFLAYNKKSEPAIEFSMNRERGT